LPSSYEISLVVCVIDCHSSAMNYQYCSSFFFLVNAVFVVVFLFNSWFGILQVFFSEWLAMVTFFTFQNNVISDVSNLA